MIRFNQVSRIYPDGTRAADSITLQIRKGEICVLLGPSGAGKSTLMGMLNGMVTPTEGTVVFEGETITRHNVKKMQQRVSMVHQQLHLVSRMSVINNVISGKLAKTPLWQTLIQAFSETDKRRACELIDEVSLEERHLYRPVSTLSGGQQQRVAIARAFMGEPEVVLADEPVAALDPNVSRSVLNNLKKASRNHNATVLCSLHQVEYAMEFADRIIALRKGKLVFDGTPSEMTDDILDQVYKGSAPNARPPVHTASPVASVALAGGYN